MAKEWESGTCNEKSGFLFSHECLQTPVSTCNLCAKPICGQHTHEFESRGKLCTTCAKKRDQRGRGTKNSPSPGRSQRESGHGDFSEPYFYGGYYFGMSYYDSYDGGGRSDPNDFTEADAASLAAESDEGFENDMSES